MSENLLPLPVQRDIPSLDTFFQHMRQVPQLVVAQLPHGFGYYDTSFQEIMPNKLNQRMPGRQAAGVTERDILETAGRIVPILSRI